MTRKLQKKLVFFGIWMLLTAGFLLVAAPSWAASLLSAPEDVPLAQSLSQEISLSFPLPDTEIPAKEMNPALPFHLKTRLTVHPEYNGKARLTWNSVDGVSSYEVYRNGKRIRSIPSDVFAEGQDYSFLDRGLTGGRSYRYMIRSLQESGEDFVPASSSNAVRILAAFRNPRVLIAESKPTPVKVIPRELEELGCTVTSVQYTEDVDITDYDALVVPGGGDVDPVLWGDFPHPSTGSFNTDRDHFQIEMIQSFAKAGKPILGICRGEQLINVAFGGSMIQNLVPDAKEPTYEKGFFTVKTADHSLVREIYGEKPRVFFKHHQAVDELGDGIRATAWSTEHPYPHIEAIQHETLPIYGVQWHPDSHTKKQGTAIFRAFYEICLENMAK